LDNLTIIFIRVLNTLFTKFSHFFSFFTCKHGKVFFSSIFSILFFAILLIMKGKHIKSNYWTKKLFLFLTYFFSFIFRILCFILFLLFFSSLSISNTFPLFIFFQYFSPHLFDDLILIVCALISFVCCDLISKQNKSFHLLID
jgi:hypothetical protein